MEELINRLSRYSPQCIAERLDYDFAEAVVDAIEILKSVDSISKLVGAAEVTPVVRCKDCIYWQKPQVKLDDGTYRDYTEEEIKGGGIVTHDVGINVGSFCAKYNHYHINDIPQFMGEDDFCSKAYMKQEVKA